jgi:hypothetical protein
MAMDCLPGSLRLCPPSKARVTEKEGQRQHFSGKVETGLPKENARLKVRILVAKPVPTFAEYARE